uniref:Small ribosomal subunit protein uS5 n=2 Tax=Hirondellea gigas TaxID=1518452 RepID=A0A6A7GEL6_9CRUS
MTDVVEKVPKPDAPKPEAKHETGFGPRGNAQRQKNQRRQRDQEKDKWVPLTKLGRLVQDRKITTMNEIFLHSLKIREFQIVDFFYPDKQNSAPGQRLNLSSLDTSGGYLHETVMKICPVQKQTVAGQRTRFKAFALIGNCMGQVGIGVKCAKEVAGAIRGAIIAAKLNIAPIRRGYWGNRIGDAHTIPMKLSGSCGSVRVRLIPAPRGSGIIGSPITKKVLFFAGVHDCFSGASGATKTSGNFMMATFYALKKSHSFLTPDLWESEKLELSPFDMNSEFLATK